MDFCIEIRNRVFRFKSNQMDSFVSNVVPNLKQIGDVRLSEQVSEAIINPSLQATMHLDLDGERLTANIRYWYDDIEIDPMQPGDTQKQRFFTNFSARY